MSIQDTFEEWGWALRNARSGGETILGANESLPPSDIEIRDLRDYSGTASINEITNILKAPDSPYHKFRVIKNGDREATTPIFNMGKFTNIAKGKVKPTQDVWLQEKSIYQNIAIVGPPKSGKTEGFIIPGIKSAIDAGLSNIVIDVKGDLIDRIGNYAESKGVRVIYWSALPANVDRSHGINLLDNVSSLQDAKILAKSLYGETEDLGQNRRYADRDITWISQWIILVKHIFGSRATLKNIYQIAENPVEKLNLLLGLCTDISITNSIQAQLRLIENDRNSDQAFTWAIQDAISFFAWNNFERVTGHSDLLLREIQTRQTLIVIGAELALRDVSKKISSAMIDILMTIFYERWSRNDVGLGIAFWIDEFPRIQKNIDLAEFSSVARSGKGGIVIAAQSLEQIDPSYRDLVMENFDTTILCRGVSNVTAEWLGNRLGNRSQNSRSRRYHEPQPEEQYSWLQIRSERERYETQRDTKPVLNAREIQYPVGDQFTAVVHCRTACRKPFLVNYERLVNISSRWNSQPLRVIWGTSTNQERSLPSSDLSRINWLDDRVNNTESSQSTDSSRINWLE